MTTSKQQLIDLTVRLGDDSLVLGQRLCEWCGHAPSTEIDLALSNMGLDLIGQAQLFLGYAGKIEGKGRDEDALAFGRDVLDFKNALLVEQPNGDFAQTMARHFLFSQWQLLLLKRLANVSDEALAGIARKSGKEIAYHASTSGEWIVRLGDGTQESRIHMIDGLDWMWRFVDELFDFENGVEDAVSAIGLSLDGLRDEWNNAVHEVLTRATLDVPAATRANTGGRNGHHTEHLGPLLAEMQYLQRTYPGAQW